MKVLHLTTHLNTGGITNYILRLIRPLRTHAVDLEIASDGGECAEEFRMQGCRLHSLPVRTKNELHPKLYFAIPKVIRIIRESHIEVLHAHTRVTQVLSGWVQKFTGIPVVTTCHGFYRNRLGRKINPAWGDRAIAISDPVGAQLREDFRVPPEKIRVINNAIDVKGLEGAHQRYAREENKACYGFRRDDYVIGIVARLVADKGHRYLIQAVSELTGQFPSIRLLIVGDGRERNTLEAYARRLGLQDRVVFTGNVTDICKPLAAMDVFAFPATWREGFGLSIIEAMACFKPVIVTNIWALNSLIDNGRTGILVEPKRSDVLAAAISQLLTDHALRERIGRQAHRVVQEFFTIERMARDLATVYREIARGRFPDKKNRISVLIS